MVAAQVGLLIAWVHVQHYDNKYILFVIFFKSFYINSTTHAIQIIAI